MNNRFLLAQVTDMHIKAGGKLSYRVVDTEASLARCIAQLMRLPQVPDAVLFTGDLVDFGRPEEYDNLARLLSPLTMPFFLMPGNHDETSRAASAGRSPRRAPVPPTRSRSTSRTTPRRASSWSHPASSCTCGARAWASSRTPRPSASSPGRIRSTRAAS
jgi:predicted MPP superfamily phosphohydrolase